MFICKKYFWNSITKYFSTSKLWFKTLCKGSGIDHAIIQSKQSSNTCKAIISILYLLIYFIFYSRRSQNAYDAWSTSSRHDSTSSSQTSASSTFNDGSTCGGTPSAPYGSSWTPYGTHATSVYLLNYNQSSLKSTLQMFFIIGRLEVWTLWLWDHRGPWPKPLPRSHPVLFRQPPPFTQHLLSRRESTSRARNKHAW